MDLRPSRRIQRLLSIDSENAKEQSMKLQKWEEIIQRIIGSSNQEPKESGKFRVLMDWRTNLAKDPYLLQLFQIDEIVREVQRRLTDIRQHQSRDAQVQKSAATSTVTV